MCATCDSDDIEYAPPTTRAFKLFAINVQLTWAKKVILIVYLYNINNTTTTATTMITTTTHTYNPIPQIVNMQYRAVIGMIAPNLHSFPLYLIISWGNIFSY